MHSHFRDGNRNPSGCSVHIVSWDESEAYRPPRVAAVVAARNTPRLHAKNGARSLMAGMVRQLFSGGLTFGVTWETARRRDDL